MADLPNRDDLEDEFSREIARILRKHQPEWSTGIAAPKTQEETRRWLLLFLPLLFVAGSRIAAGELRIGVDASGPGRTWAGTYAPWLSRLIVQRVIERARMLRTNPPVVEPVPSDVPQVGVPIAPIDTEELNRLLDEIAAEERWANMAATEVTRAAVAGGEYSASVHDAGMTEPALAFWYTSTNKKGQPDDRVCRICRPLHLTERENWQQYFPEGPPAHPMCRCWIDYQPQ